MTSIFEILGREDGCRALSKSFYARVAKDTVLKPLFPGKSLRCATEEFAAFLIQFFDGDENKTQYRCWLSLRQSHARFKVTEAQRSTWVALMRLALTETVEDEQTATALTEFFVHASHYVLGQQAPAVTDPELAERWQRQLLLDDLITKLARGSDADAMCIADQFIDRKSVFVGILAKMIETGRPALIDYAIASIDRDPDLCGHSFNGRTLLHFAAGFGCTGLVQKLLSKGMDPNVLDAGGHAPLYRASSCDSAEPTVRALVAAGARVNDGAGLARSTALHQAARYGNVHVAATLIELGADVNARDARGLTARDRAINCRRRDVADFLAQSDLTKTKSK